MPCWTIWRARRGPRRSDGLAGCCKQPLVCLAGKGPDPGKVVAVPGRSGNALHLPACCAIMDPQEPFAQAQQEAGPRHGRAGRWPGALGARLVLIPVWCCGRDDGPCQRGGDNAIAPPGGNRKRDPRFPRPLGTVPCRPAGPGDTEASIRVRQGFRIGLVSCHSRPSRRSVLARMRSLRIAATRASLGGFPAVRRRVKRAARSRFLRMAVRVGM